MIFVRLELVSWNFVYFFLVYLLLAMAGSVGRVW